MSDSTKISLIPETPKLTYHSTPQQPLQLPQSIIRAPPPAPIKQQMVSKINIDNNLSEW